MKLILTLLSAILLCSTTLAAPKITLTPNNTVTFRGVVDDGSTTKATVQLLSLIQKRGDARYPIYLVLDSPGGSITAGEDFISFAKTLPRVETVSLFAASMASGIVEGLPGKRHVAQNGILMFHRARGSFEGQFETGELESELEIWKKIVRSMEQRSADRMSISLADYKAHALNEWWLYGADSVSAKAADDVVDLQCSQDLIDKREVKDEMVFIFVIRSVYSLCPLMRQPLLSGAIDNKKGKSKWS